MLELLLHFAKLLFAFFTVSFIVMGWWNLFDGERSIWGSIKYTAWKALAPAGVLATGLFVIEVVYGLFN